MVRKVALVVVVALCLGSLPGVALAAGPSFTPGSPGIGDPYFPLDGNGGYNVRHYDLDVKYDPATDVLTGKATITARATQNLSSFNLDFVGLTVRSIKVNGKTATWSRDAGELTVTPKNGLRRNVGFNVVVRYDGVPETINDLFGFSGFIHTDDGALVVGEPHVAATWFPANDHPSDKASVTFRVTVPAGLEAVAMGVLKSQRTRAGWTTWTWDAKEPMATYLAGMGIGQFDIRSYREDGIKYWDAIDSTLMADLAPPVTPIAGAQFLYSQIGEPAYKRLTHTVDVAPGGEQLTFLVDRDTEPGWDFLFVEARTVGQEDWTTLPDANGHTSQDTGACPNFLFANPFLGHYVTDVPPDDNGTPDDPEDDMFFPCEPSGTSGVWHAASGLGEGWETWDIEIPNAGMTSRPVEVSITYASDEFVQGRGVAIDDVFVSTGQGTTSFENDGNVLDGWVAPIAGPEGSAPNPNTWDVASFLPAVPGLGESALVSFDRQPEIIEFEAGIFGRYPFSAGGGIVDAVEIFFALENQTRPIYSPFFFSGGPNDFVVVHEIAHQWYGDSLAVDRWQHIWLNEGFATYAEWLWSEHEGFDTAQQIYDFWSTVPDDDPLWELVIGDPGPDHLFDFPVYVRGALTLHALRLEVGDRDFFRILRQWARTQAGGNVTTDEFIRLSERISHEDLDALFDAWLFTSGKPDFGSALRRQAVNELSLRNAPAEVRSLVERLKDRPGQPFR